MQNYKCHKNSIISNCSDFHTFVGKNSSGKTSILECCQLIKDHTKEIQDIKDSVRNMISESFTMIGVSPSWLRKLLPEYLKSTKHTRKDYLELQQQRDRQPLQEEHHVQREQVELRALSSTRYPTYGPTTNFCGLILGVQSIWHTLKPIF
jgi:predicted ATPase